MAVSAASAGVELGAQDVADLDEPREQGGELGVEDSGHRLPIDAFIVVGDAIARAGHSSPRSLRHGNLEGVCDDGSAATPGAGRSADCEEPMGSDRGTPTPLDISQAETRAAFANRALVYLHMYQTLAEELGPEQAIELMRRAIYEHGVEIGEKYRQAAEEGDLEEIGAIFCEGSPCDGALFEPGVEEFGTSRIVLRMTACPLVEAWREHGVPDYEIDILCGIAAAVDEGTFEGAGLDLEFLDRLGQPGSERCLLDIRLR